MAEPHDDPVFDASDEDQVKERKKVAKQADDDRLETLNGIMGTTQGRDWMFALLERCRVFATPFSTNALLMANAVGHQDIGRYLLGDLTTPDNFELYALMLREQKEKANGR
jgi:hypothetical protein